MLRHPVVRFYLDEDVHKRVAAGLRLRDVDVVTPHDISTLGVSDAQQLDLAARHARVLVTFNVADFARLHRQWLESGRSHSGIVVSAQVGPGEMTRRRLRLAGAVSAEEMQNQLRWLRDFA